MKTNKQIWSLVPVPGAEFLESSYLVSNNGGKYIFNAKIRLLTMIPSMGLLYLVEYVGQYEGLCFSKDSF